jgi:hypothetical protein
VYMYIHNQQESQVITQNKPELQIDRNSFLFPFLPSRRKNE